MDIKQLKAFREVMLTGSVSRAASNLFLTQPAVSLQISRLEKAVGLKLFSRHSGRLHPVPEAEYLFAQATQILEQIENVQKNLARVCELEVGQLDIVAMAGPSIFYIPRLISDFVEQRPGINVSLYSHSSFQTQQLLSAQRYDVGLVDILPAPDQLPALIDYDTIDYRCVCAVPEHDPLAAQSSVSAQDLDGKPLAILLESHPVSKQLQRIFVQQGLTMKRRFDTRYFIPQLTFVEQGLAYAIVDPITVESYRLYRNTMGTIRFLPFKPAIHFSIAIGTPAYRPISTIANSFIRYLKSTLTALQ